MADIKANNIMVQMTPPESEWKIAKVQVVDLEDSAHLRGPESAVIGAQVGNIMWRSPEAHAMGPIRKPSDIFSFGLVVSLISVLALITWSSRLTML